MDELFMWGKSVGVPTIMLIAAAFIVAKLALNSILTTVRTEQEAARRAVKTAVDDAQKNFTDALAGARKEYIASLDTTRQEFLEALERRDAFSKKIAEEHARTEARCLASSEAIQRELLSVIAGLKGVRRIPDASTRPRPIRPLPPGTPPPGPST